MESQILDREGRLTVRRMVRGDINIVSDKLSGSDRKELALLGITPYEAMAAGYRLGSFSGCLDGEPECCFGLNSRVEPAAIWLLGSDAVRKQRKSFIAITKRWVAMLNRDKSVGNIVPDCNVKTIRWLKSLDFEFDPDVYTVNGSAFRRFRRGPLTSSLPH